MTVSILLLLYPLIQLRVARDHGRFVGFGYLADLGDYVRMIGRDVVGFRRIMAEMV